MYLQSQQFQYYRYLLLVVFISLVMHGIVRNHNWNKFIKKEVEGRMQKLFIFILEGYITS